jgi:hypothetical protein
MLYEKINTTENVEQSCVPTSKGNIFDMVIKICILANGPHVRGKLESALELGLVRIFSILGLYAVSLPYLVYAFLFTTP